VTSCALDVGGLTCLGVCCFLLAWRQSAPGDSTAEKAKKFLKNNWQWFVLGAGIIGAFFVLRALWRCCCGDSEEKQQQRQVYDWWCPSHSNAAAIAYAPARTLLFAYQC